MRDCEKKQKGSEFSDEEGKEERVGKGRKGRKIEVVANQVSRGVETGKIAKEGNYSGLVTVKSVLKVFGMDNCGQSRRTL